MDVPHSAGDNMLEKPKLFYFYKGRLFITYRSKYTQWYNEHFKKPWHCWDEWAICIGHEPDAGMFNKEDLYYDGHTYKSITLFGISLGKMYSYQSEER